MKTIRIRALRAGPPTNPFFGWEEWVDVEYEVNPVGSERLYTVSSFKMQDREGGTFGSAPLPMRKGSVLDDFLRLNSHLLDVEISKRVMKRDHQRPDDLPESKGRIRMRPNKGHGTPSLLPDL